MPDAFIVGSFVHLLQAFVPCFTAPSFPTFAALMGGWPLATGRHTVTGVVRAANAVGWKHIRTFHRFFSEGAWLPDELGLILVGLVVERCLKPGDTCSQGLSPLVFASRSLTPKAAPAALPSAALTLKPGRITDGRH